MPGSERAKQVLNDWDKHLPQFVKVISVEYKKVLAERKAQKVKMASKEAAVHG